MQTGLWGKASVGYVGVRNVFHLNMPLLLRPSACYHVDSPVGYLESLCFGQGVRQVNSSLPTHIPTSSGILPSRAVPHILDRS